MRRFILPLIALSVAACNREVTGPGPETPAELQSATVSAAANSWVKTASMPRARKYVDAATIGSIIYVVGGANGADNATTTLQAYNVKTNSWSLLTPLPNPRAWTNGVSVINGRLYVSGGYGQKSLFVYDPASKVWTRKADMPVPAFYGAQGVIGGQLYVYGAAGSNRPLGHSFWHYNPATNSWTELVTPAYVHADAAAGVIAGKLYLAGGEDFDGTHLSKVEVYNPSTRTWTMRRPMPDRASGMASAVLGGKLYAAGGEHHYLSPDVAALSVYDPATNTWTGKAPMRAPRSQMAGAAANGRFFVMGGYNGSGPLVRVEAYTP